ncbi:hypothetical protein ACQZ6V_10705 [Agrobacterium sp. 22-3674b3]
MFDDDNFRVVFRQGKSDFLWVTFGFWGQSIETAWGQEVAEKLDYSLLSFHDKRYRWYAGLEEILPVVRPIIDQFKSVVAMGVSMGGYAAVKFSKALNCNVTMAVVPQYSINPGDVLDPRYNDWYNVDAHREMRIKEEDVGGTIYNLVDPYFSPDVLHSDYISKISNAVVIHTPFTGHFAISAYHGSSVMKQVIAAMLKKDTSSLRALANTGRKLSPQRAVGLISASWARKPALARALLESYRHKVSANVLQDSLSEVARRLWRDGMQKPALSAMREAIIASPEARHIHFEYSKMLKPYDVRGAFVHAEIAAGDGSPERVEWRNSLADEMIRTASKKGFLVSVWSKIATLEFTRLFSRSAARQR